MKAMNHGGIYLSELLYGFSVIDPEQDLHISGIELDSRNLSPGDCFIALNGHECNGIDFIPDAMCKGATAILVDENDLNILSQRLEVKNNLWNIFYIEDLAQKVGQIAHRYFGEPTDLMKVFGVTGTNGKTSVSHFIAQAIDKITGSGTCGVIGTLGNGLFGEFISSGMTTPDAIQTHRSLSRLHEQGAHATVIEASSHGLAQNRLSGVDFDVAVFTNLSQDHLDYHGNMQAYGEAKLKLFRVPELQAAVINLDDPFADQILDVLYEREEGDVTITGYTLGEKSYPGIRTIRCNQLAVTSGGLRMEVSAPDGVSVLETNILGRFNASNLLAALGALLACGFKFEEVIEALSSVVGVPGRMEVFKEEGKPTIVVDFAHTSDGLCKALETLKEVSDGKVWCVFGCGGDRDKTKRSLMGSVAESMADEIIITNDNPRSEAQNVIASGILAGMKKPRKAKVIFDRKKAIESAINSANENDVILIAGKGHEDWQEINGQRFAFNDRNVVINHIGREISYD